MKDFEHVSYTSSLFYFNFPKNRVAKSMVSVDENIHLGDMIKDLKNRNLLNITDDRPAFIYCSNGKIHDLELLRHSKSTRDFLNNNGLTIYLLEPISFYIANDKNINVKYNQYNMGFFSEFPNHAVSKDSIRSGELDSIITYVRDNELTNVEVRTCDYNMDNFLVHYKDAVSLVCDDIFLSTLKFYDNIKVENKTEIKKKFISVNWRYQPHRAIISSYIIKNFFKHSYVTWYFRLNKKIIDESIWASESEALKFDEQLYKDYISGLQKLNSKSPLYLDIPATKHVKVTYNHGTFFPKFTNSNLDNGMNPTIINDVSQPLQHYYSHTFVSVVNESRYAQPTANFSEKVIQPIMYRTPFVLVAPPLTLEYLKDAGYKTFNKWWDESYDLETNHLKRMKKIIDVLEYINCFSYEELTSIYADMMSVLDHNFNNFLSISSIQQPREDISSTHVAWMPSDSQIET